MRTLTKVAVTVSLAVVAVAVLVCAPVIANPTGCDFAVNGGGIQPGGPVCIPYEMDSVSYHYLGFGVFSSYKGEFYYFCTPDWCQGI